MLNEDYFTIHSASVKRKNDGLSLAPTSTWPSAYSRATTNLEGPDEDMDLEEITDIPSLMRALKRGIVDREKIEYLKKFVERGGEELYYLDENVIGLLCFILSRPQADSIPTDTRDNVSIHLSELEMAIFGLFNCCHRGAFWEYSPNSRQRGR